MSQQPQCIIAGGGPAGIVAGLLLARCGITVTVLEKHADFLRDFRGDTIHPSTLLLLDQLGLMEQFQQIGYSTVTEAKLPEVDGQEVTVVNLGQLKHPYPFIAMAPQWDFLNLLAEAGAQEENFELRLNCEVTDLIIENGQVGGVHYRDPAGEGQLHAPLTIAADGRWSTLRERAELRVKELPVPLDIWWFRISTQRQGQNSLVPAFAPHRIFILIPRIDYVQAGMLLPKGEDQKQRAAGIQALRDAIVSAEPALEDGVKKLELEQVKLLQIQVNRANKWWRPGLLCIGDSAHAMSPVGGIGVNLAVQDAVAAARILAAPLRQGTISDRDLAKVQRRRQPTTVVVQMAQRMMHRGLTQILGKDEPLRLPRGVAEIYRRFPRLAVIPARLLGVGIIQEAPPAAARRN